LKKIRNIEFAGVAVKGLMHVEENMPCQDYVFSKKSNNTNVIALADGASSYEKTEIGAEISTKFVANLISKNFHNLFKKDNNTIAEVLLAGIEEELLAKGKELNLDIRDNHLGSTLLFVAVHNNQYLAGHIGDGLIGYVEDKQQKILSAPENPDSKNKTILTTSAKKALDNFRIYKGETRKIDGFIIMSDGACESLYINKKLGKNTVTILEWLQEHERSTVEKELYDNIEKFFLKKTSDDCSINLLTLTRNESIMDKDTKVDKQIDLNELASNVAKNKVKIERLEDGLSSIRKQSQSIQSTNAKIQKLEDDFSSIKKQSQSIQSKHDKKINDIKNNIDSLQHRMKDIQKKSDTKPESKNAEVMITDHNLENKIKNLTILVVINFIALILLFILVWR